MRASRQRIPMIKASESAFDSGWPVDGVFHCAAAWLSPQNDRGEDGKKHRGEENLSSRNSAEEVNFLKLGC